MHFSSKFVFVVFARLAFICVSKGKDMLEESYSPK